ncbi:hypothetical protein CLAFUW4_08119 [Fulvia fulva]|uniref:Uncharacterized protein n=1 Tax=Passalora fulva TaxID=5499 RepID=A0A9Q8LCF8_PASFU|nr:uncharacterized protein CLAFUR5_08234 [Fulvia fulva]KAK4629081.1 hypothetical protein CLAFUR4_08124 [Fulvia fulva]KAK4630173.1 hypothetical protein CLAFUR0_08119 [Fulvia fulva]UJO14887.1 hypothetical protein CLAFUR5_08234 [Fulvia fulva]WPV12711.1 hypothetical protein CLAFUW4_08119 [Fulvia fulva]WPV27313.1 hypothetical protein CLAFUW7_08119 [Fulvia fulva]
MDAMNFQQRKDEKYQYLDPRLRNTEGVLLPETGAQFEGESQFDASYQSQDDFAGELSIDLEAGIPWISELELGPGDGRMVLQNHMPSATLGGQQRMTSDNLSRDMEEHMDVQGHTHSPNLADQSVMAPDHSYRDLEPQLHYQDGVDWLPTTPLPSHLQQQMLATPPASCSPRSIPQGDNALPQIALPQSRLQHSPHLNLNTSQPPLMVYRDTLSPYDAYRTPISCTSTQQDYFDAPSTPTRQPPMRRGRANSAVGYGMAHLMTEQFLEQSDQRFDIQRWAFQNTNVTNQMREVQSAPQAQPRQTSTGVNMKAVRRSARPNKTYNITKDTTKKERTSATNARKAFNSQRTYLVISRVRSITREGEASTNVMFAVADSSTKAGHGETTGNDTWRRSMDMYFQQDRGMVQKLDDDSEGMIRI